MKIYHDMIDEVLQYGTRKENRTGVDTLSTFNYNYELTWDERLRGSVTTYVGDSVDGNHRLPLLTTKKVSWKNIVVEMLWFLSGDPHIQILKQHKCGFWDPWVDAKGEVPMAYGNVWRRFPGLQATLDSDVPSLRYNDQIRYVLDGLRNNPMSRRLVVSAWAPHQAQVASLPPCHMLYLFNVQNVEESTMELFKRAVRETPSEASNLTRRIEAGQLDSFEGRNMVRRDLIAAGVVPKVEQRLCLHLTQRSCDLALGVPYNMASYGLLLLIMSHLTGIKPGIFAHTLLDLHIYTKKLDGSMGEYDHIPGLKGQRTRTPKTLPKLSIDPSIQELSDIEALMRPDVTTEKILEVFRLEGYNPHPPVKFKVAV